MTEQQFNAIFDQGAIIRKGEQFFPLCHVRDAYGDDFAAFADMAFGDVMNRKSPYHVARPCLLKIFRSFSEEKPAADQQAGTNKKPEEHSGQRQERKENKTMNGVNLVINHLYDPDSRPNAAVAYDPSAHLIEADEKHVEALNALRSKLTFEEVDSIETAACNYSTAAAMEAFDRGFRQGARHVLQLILG